MTTVYNVNKEAHAFHEWLDFCYVLSFEFLTGVVGFYRLWNGIELDLQIFQYMLAFSNYIYFSIGF